MRLLLPPDINIVHSYFGQSSWFNQYRNIFVSSKVVNWISNLSNLFLEATTRVIYKPFLWYLLEGRGGVVLPGRPIQMNHLSIKQIAAVKLIRSLLCSYLGKQCAADRTQFLVIMDPPQTWLLPFCRCKRESAEWVSPASLAMADLANKDNASPHCT